MAQDILTVFVYLFGVILIVTVIDVAIAVFQIIEDIPAVRKKVWKFCTQGLRKTNSAHS